MQQHLILAGMLIGGLGLFMLAVSMINDGLKSAAAMPCVICWEAGQAHLFMVFSLASQSQLVNDAHMDTDT